jgi:hypothetical protein
MRIPQSGDRRGLVVEPANPIGLGTQIAAQNFHRHRTAKHGVFRQVDRRHPA